jgi:hypothetical protein
MAEEEVAATQQQTLFATNIWTVVVPNLNLFYKLYLNKHYFINKKKRHYISPTPLLFFKKRERLYRIYN